MEKLRLNLEKKRNKNIFLDKKFTKNKINKSLENPINFWKQKEICRKNFQEDLPRENIKVRDFIENENNFQIIDNKKLKIISKESENITFSIMFNNFHRLSQIIKNFYDLNKQNPENKIKSIQEAYLKMTKNTDLNQWTNCSGMAEILKENLEKNWIYSYIVRFEAFWYINDEFMKDWHSALIIPAKINWENKFIFLDPGIRIFKPIIFDENWTNEVFCDGKYFSIEKYDEKNSDFTYKLKSKTENQKENCYAFCHNQEWLNHNETLIPQSIRYRRKYKIQKFNPNENILFIMDVEDNYFTLKLEEELIKINFSEFIDFFKNWKNHKNKEIFFKIIEKFWFEKEIFIKEIFEIIENIELIQQVLLSPSTKKIIEKRKNI